MKNNNWNKDVPTENLKWYEKKSKKLFDSKALVKDEDKRERGERNYAKKKARKRAEYETREAAEPKKELVRPDFADEFPVDAKRLDSLFQRESIPEDAFKILQEFNRIVYDSHPLGSKQQAQLPNIIRELSHQLTDERGERRIGYMNQTETLAAYVHYYVWWNLVRLVRLFANLPEDYFRFSDSAVCLDIGSGPLTVPIALMLARPELRKKNLTWYCMDLSAQSMAFGEDVFITVAARLQCEPWKIIRVKGQLGTTLKEKVNFVTCANALNEIYEDVSMPPDFLAKKYCEKVLAYTDRERSDTRILIVEPGVPRAARFLSQFRDAFIRRGYAPCSPCTHCAECPMQGKKGGKWCNYAFSTYDAPAGLKRLSETARLPKERAVLSFVALRAVKKSKNTEESNTGLIKQDEITTDLNKSLKVRIASDEIRLPMGRSGYYACSENGLMLIRTHRRLFSGQCLELDMSKLKSTDSMPVDEKSGAFIVDAKFDKND